MTNLSQPTPHEPADAIDPELLPLELREQTAPEAPRRRLTPGTIVLLLGVVAFVIAIGIAFARSQRSQPQDGLAPNFSVTTFDGETFTLDDLRGQVVVLNFWASWCVPCRIESPALEAVWQDYRARGVTVLGIAHADIERNSRAFIAEYNLTYPNAPDIGTVISRDLYFINGVPETFIIDQQGRVVDYIRSVVDEDDLRATLDRVLGVAAGAEVGG